MLVTAGCSFVWGDELDGFDTNPPSHWELTWTHLLSQALGTEYVNLGSCGASNDKIFREVVSYLHNPANERPTHMVVLWSAWQRHEIVEYMRPNRIARLNLMRTNDVTQFSPMRTEVIGNKLARKAYANLFLDAYDSRTDIMHGLTRMQSMELICESMGIHLIQGVFHHNAWGNILSTLKDQGAAHDATVYALKKIDAAPAYKQWLTDAVGSLKKTSRFGLGRAPTLSNIMHEIGDVKPFGHPGERSQEIWAEILYETFKTFGTDEPLPKVKQFSLYK